MISWCSYSEYLDQPRQSSCLYDSVEMEMLQVTHCLNFMSQIGHTFLFYSIAMFLCIVLFVF